MNTPVFSFENVWNAYLRCRKTKRRKKSALAFEWNAEDNVLDLANALQGRTYAPLKSVCFVTESPKPREIFAARFRDRVVHHLLVGRLEPEWERRFIHDSFACRRGKGTHAAVRRLQRFMRKASANGTRKAYALHLDIRSFFVSIDKRLLFDMMARKEKDPEILWLLAVVIFHDPALNPVMKGPVHRFRLIPPFKSLFHTGNRTGLPIGNYTSQFFANVYLDALDQFVKHRLKCRYYIRYVDDLVLVSRDRSQLAEWEGRISDFLKSRLHLALNDARRKLVPVRGGCDFLGYIVKPAYITVRRRVVNNLKHKLARFSHSMVREHEGRRIIHHGPQRVDRLQSVLA